MTAEMIIVVPHEDAAPRRREVTRVRRTLARHAAGVISGIVIAALIVIALGADLIAPYSPSDIDAGRPLEDPSLAHPFGTDRQGRDVLSRTIHGARISMGVGVAAAVAGTALGVLLGMTSGYTGGTQDRFSQTLLDIGLAFPGIVALMAVVAAWGRDWWIIVLAIAATAVPVVMRVMRASVIKEKESLYVEATRALGATNARIIARHLLPNVAPTIIVLVSAMVPIAILSESTLSFFGLAFRPPTASWGGDLSGDARAYFELQPWLAIAPGAALSLTVLAFNMLGDTLRDVLDPRMRGSE